MNIVSLISAVLISAMTPISLPELSGIRDGRAVFLEDVAVVAVIPDAFYGMESKRETLESVTKTLGEEWEKEIYLTDDLITYITLSRIEKRGVDDYERHNLASRLAKVRSYCYEREEITG